MEFWIILAKSLLTFLVLLPVNVAQADPPDNNVLHPPGRGPLLDCQPQPLNLLGSKPGPFTASNGVYGECKSIKTMKVIRASLKGIC